MVLWVCINERKIDDGKSTEAENCLEGRTSE